MFVHAFACFIVLSWTLKMLSFQLERRCIQCLLHVFVLGKLCGYVGWIFPKCPGFSYCSVKQAEVYQFAHSFYIMSIHEQMCVRQRGEAVLETESIDDNEDAKIRKYGDFPKAHSAPLDAVSQFHHWPYDKSCNDTIANSCKWFDDEHRGLCWSSSPENWQRWKLAATFCLPALQMSVRVWFKVKGWNGVTPELNTEEPNTYVRARFCLLFHFQ